MKQKIQIGRLVPWLIAIVVFLIFFATAGAYLVKFGMDGTGGQGEWGQFGDYFGGTLNPVLGVFTVIGVLLTYELQRRQLKLTQKELTRQAKLGQKTAKLSALTAALDAVNVLIETKSNPARSMLDSHLAVNQREAIIREILRIADIDPATYVPGYARTEEADSAKNNAEG